MTHTQHQTYRPACGMRTISIIVQLPPLARPTRTKINLLGEALFKKQVEYLLVHPHDSIEDIIEDTHNIPLHSSVNVIGVVQS